MTESTTSWTARSATEAFPVVTGRHRLAEPAPETTAVDPLPAGPAPAPAPSAEPTGEPVIIAHAVTVILGALVTAGWVTIPDTTIDLVGTVVALALSTVAAVLARARVTPLKGGLWKAVEGYVVDVVRVELEGRAIR